MKNIFKVSNIYQNKLNKFSSLLKKEIVDEEDYHEILSHFNDVLVELDKMLMEFKSDLKTHKEEDILSFDPNSILKIIFNYFHEIDFFEIRLPNYYVSTTYDYANFYSIDEAIKNLIELTNKVYDYDTFVLKDQGNITEDLDEGYYSVKFVTIKILEFFIEFCSNMKDIFATLAWAVFANKCTIYLNFLKSVKTNIENYQTNYEKDQEEKLMQDLMGEDYEDEEMREAFRQGKYF